MRTRSFILLATFCVAFLFGVRAQDRVTSYAHLGISSQIAPDFFHGIGTDIEGGIHWQGFMASAALTLWSDYPLKNDHRYLTISRQPGGSASVGDVVDLDGKPFYWATRDVSIMIQAGYDLLRFIPRNMRHHLWPYVGIGWTAITQDFSYSAQTCAFMEGSDDPYFSTMFHFRSTGFDYCVGARYAFSITDKWMVGLTYKYLDALEDHLMSLHVSRAF